MGAQWEGQLRRVGRHQETKSYKWLIRKSQELQIGTKGEYENLCNSVTLAEVGSLEELFQCIKLFEGHEIIIDISRHHFRTVVSLDKNKGSYNDHEHMDPYLFIHLPLIRTKAPCQIRDHWQSVLFDRLIENQRIIPGLSYTDIAPISKLTLTDLQLYQDIQIFRGKLNSTDGIKQLTDEERLAAVRRLAERIPLKLAKKEAHDALSRMIARGDPYTKAGIRKILLPSLFYEQLKNEGIAQKKRINRTEWIKTFTGLTPEVRPSGYTLSTYWVWLKDEVQKALQFYVLELESRDPKKQSKRAASPVLLGIDYNRWGEITNETGEYEKNKRRSHEPSVEIISGADFGNLARNSRKRHYEAIDEASPDEANFELCSDRGFDEDGNPTEAKSGLGSDLFDTANPEAYEFAEDAFESDLEGLEELQQPIEILAKEIKVDPVIVLDTVKSELKPRDRKYVTRLLKILHNSPRLSLPEARKQTREKLGIKPGNERQIWSRITHYSGVKGRQKYYDAVSAHGHALLRPDGTEMRVPAWVFGALRGMNLLLESQSGAPQLSPAIHAVLGKPERAVTAKRNITRKRIFMPAVQIPPSVPVVISTSNDLAVKAKPPIKLSGTADGKRYSCGECGRQFREWFSVTEHIRLQHTQKSERREAAKIPPESTGVFPRRSNLCGIRPGTIARLVQTLGHNLEGPGDKVSCDCPRCRF